MALFKIFKGEFASTLNERRPNANEGYCYFAINEGKMFIDIGDGDVRKNPELRVCLNAAHADEADRLTWYNIGDEQKPIYLNGSGEPVECDDILAIGISGGLHDVNGVLRTVGTTDKPVYFDNGLPVECKEFLPLHAGEQYKIRGPLGLTLDENYGTQLPVTGFGGEIFFVEDPNIYLSLPVGGQSGQILMKNSSNNGDSIWVNLEDYYLPLNGGILTGSLTTPYYITTNYGLQDPNVSNPPGTGENGALYFKIL